MYFKVSRGFRPSCKNRGASALRGFCPTGLLPYNPLGRILTSEKLNWQSNQSVIGSDSFGLPRTEMLAQSWMANLIQRSNLMENMSCSLKND